MANNNTTLTQAAALRWLIDNAQDAPQDVITKAEELYTSKTKKYDRPKTISKERMANEKLVPMFVEMMHNAPADELINATWLNDHCDHVDVRSPQKARVIAEIAIEQGLVEKYSHKGRTYYRVTE